MTQPHGKQAAGDLVGGDAKRRRTEEEAGASPRLRAEEKSNSRSAAGKKAADDDDDSSSEADEQEVSRLLADAFGGGSDSSSSSSSSEDEDDDKAPPARTTAASPAAAAGAAAATTPASAAAPAGASADESTAAGEKTAPIGLPPSVAGLISPDTADPDALFPASPTPQSRKGQRAGLATPRRRSRVATPRTGKSKSDAPSDSDSESSAGSSSSSSDSESIVGEVAKRIEDEGDGLIPEPELVESEETKRLKALLTLRGAQIRRDELVSMLLNLPEEEAASAILRSFVRLTVQAQPGVQEGCCVLAEVAGIEHSAPYPVSVKGDRGVDARTLVFQLRCKRGSSTRPVKISSVSNGEVTESEFDQWRRLSLRAGIDEGYYLEQMKQKAYDIQAARRFNFDETTVSRQLQRKPPVKIDAQDESKMRFLVQCALSQMDISGIRDYEAGELDHRYHEALKGLHAREKNSSQAQEEWFDKRPNLFSLKVINQKNLDRQLRDDRHALKFALEAEGAAASLNPFERRPCRPVSAWDTQLTEVEALPKPKQKEGTEAKAIQDSTKAPAASGAAQNGMAAASEDSEAGRGMSRVDRVMRAHRQADLLGKLGPLLAAQVA